MCALHPEEPLVALLRLVHLRVALTRTVLRRGRGRDDARIHDRPLLQPMTLRRQVRVDRTKQFPAQVMPLQQMPEVQDRRLVRQRTRQPQPDEPAHRLHFVQQVLHAGIAQVVEQLHAVHPQHHPQRIRPPAAACLRIERRNLRLQAAPRDQTVHLLQE